MPSRIYLFGMRKGEFQSALASALTDGDASLEVVQQTDVRMDRDPFSVNFNENDTIVSRFVHRPPHAQTATGLTTFFEREEWANLVYGLAHTLGSGIFYNDPALARIANSKHAQLEVARSVGLKTPRTLITNNMAKVREFMASLQGAVIVKPIDCSVAPNPSKPDDTLLLYTREVHEAELGTEDQEVSGSPAIFQERIHKDRELRVVVHGEEAVGVAIDSQRHPNSTLDWRRRLGDSNMYSYEEIDEELKVKLAAYLRCLGLHSGVFDLAIDHDGNAVFFECNPNGQWYDMDKSLGGKIMNLTVRSITAFALFRRDQSRTVYSLAS